MNFTNIFSVRITPYVYNIQQNFVIRGRGIINAVNGMQTLQRNIYRRRETGSVSKILYAVVHEYLRDNEDEDFDVYHLADAMDVSPVDIQALIDLGYLERDLGLYGKHETARSRLAHAFTNEIDKMRRNKLTTFGGQVYARSYSSEDSLRTVRRR